MPWRQHPDKPDALCPKSVQFVEMDIFFLRIDVPKRKAFRQAGREQSCLRRGDSAVGKVEQFVEILLGDKRILIRVMCSL